MCPTYGGKHALRERRLLPVQRQTYCTPSGTHYQRGTPQEPWSFPPLSLWVSVCVLTRGENQHLHSLKPTFCIPESLFPGKANSVAMPKIFHLFYFLYLYFSKSRRRCGVRFQPRLIKHRRVRQWETFLIHFPKISFKNSWLIDAYWGMKWGAMLRTKRFGREDLTGGSTDVSSSPPLCRSPWEFWWGVCLADVWWDRYETMDG